MMNDDALVSLISPCDDDALHIYCCCCCCYSILDACHPMDRSSVRLTYSEEMCNFFIKQDTRIMYMYVLTLFIRATNDK